MGMVALPGAEELLGDLSHSLQMIPSVGELVKLVKSIRDAVLLEVGLESLLVLVPLVDHGLLLSLEGGSHLSNLSRRVLAAAGRAVFRGILALSLPTLGRVGARSLASWGRGAHVQRASIVIVHTSHVVL